jgi:hypothetical protein
MSQDASGGEGLEAAGEALQFAEKHGYFSQFGRFTSDKRLRRSLMLAAISGAHFRAHRFYVDMAFEPLSDGFSRAEAIRQDPALYAALSIAASSQTPVPVAAEQERYLLELDSFNAVDRRVLALHLLNPGRSFTARDLAAADSQLSARESASAQGRLVDSGLLSSLGRGDRGALETAFDRGI